MLQHFTNIKALIVLLTLLGITNIAWSQHQEKAQISGRISATSGEVLAGVSIAFKGTQIGTNSDTKGRFELTGIAPGNYTLVINLVGFETQEKAIQLKPAQHSELNFTLRDKAYEVQGVEIVGKSETRKVNDQAYTVTAISMKELQNSSQDAKEVLNRVSGVKVLEEGGLGSNISFSLNGFSGDQVKFFLDGIPMDNFGSSLSLSDIPVNTIDRIEVYKGVVPVWLGTDALGGAVNIITNQKDKFLDASYSIGSFNTHRISLNGAATSLNSGFTVRGNVNYNYSDNNYKVWVPVEDALGNELYKTNTERFHDRYRSATVKLETGWVNRKFADNLLFGIIATGNDKQMQTGVNMNRVFGGITRSSQSFIPTLKYSKENLFTEGLNVSFAGAYNLTESQVIDTLRGVRYNWLGDTTMTWDSTDGELKRTFTTLNDTDFNSQFNAGYTLSPKHSVAFNYAFSYFYRKGFDSEYNIDSVENAGNRFPKSLYKQVAGLAYKFDPNARWSTTFFGKAYFLKAQTSKQYDYALQTQRTDVYESNKENFGYGAATTYFLLPNLQLKASYEHTYRLPLPDEIFGDGLFVIPNPDLGPEKSDNLNLGAAYGFDLGIEHHFNLESSLIYRESKDMIHRVVSNNPQAPFRNLAEARTKGVEGSLKYSWREMFHFGSSITFQDITDQADSVYNESLTNTGWQKNYQQGFRLPNTPRLFGNANAGLTFKNLLTPESAWSLNYYFNFSDQYYLSWTRLDTKNKEELIPRQTSHNLEISCSLKEGKYNLTAECRNLTNALLYDKFYLQKPGRAFYLKLRYVL